jgi:tripartite-type tricarboxylate transporter receptor subunit TctC
MRLVMMAAAVALAASAAHAQTYPTKPVHVIVPFTPGSATDVVARTVAQALSTRMGQVFVVENRPGAGGTIGANLVAKAAPDGYTLLVNSSGHTVNPSIYPSLPFDTAKDFTGVSLLAEQPNILVVAPSKGWKTAGDLVKAAKTEPGKLSYASAGAGSATHMNAEKFRVSAAIDAVHIPYKGTPEALTDTMNGRVDYFFAPVIAALPMVRDNRVTALAVGSAKRASVLPNVPTTEEGGLPGQRLQFLGRHAGAGRHAARHRRAAQQGSHGRPRLARGQGSVGGTRCRRRADARRRLRQDDCAGAQGQCRAGEAGWHHGAMT